MILDGREEEDGSPRREDEEDVRCRPTEPGIGKQRKSEKSQPSVFPKDKKRRECSEDRTTGCDNNREAKQVNIFFFPFQNRKPGMFYLQSEEKESVMVKCKKREQDFLIR